MHKCTRKEVHCHDEAVGGPRYQQQTALAANAIRTSAHLEQSSRSGGVSRSLADTQTERLEPAGQPLGDMTAVEGRAAKGAGG
jgi:hypothetical protein